MNDALELHDSRLVSLRIVDRGAVLRFAPAYVHRSAGRPGFDAGSGWLQDLDLILFDATVLDSPAEWPFEDCDVADGRLTIDAMPWDNPIPLPFSCRGDTTFSAILASGEPILIRASGMESVPRGEPRFLEHAPADVDERSRIRSIQAKQGES